jgi:hypothetical protein
MSEYILIVIQTVVALAALVIAIIPLVPGPIPWRRYLPYAAALLAGVVIGTQVSRIQVNSGPFANIVQPKAGDFVPQYIDVSGVFGNIPDNKHLWVFIKATNLYYPAKVSKSSDKEWSSKSIQIGPKIESGSSYTLIITWVDDADDATLLEIDISGKSLPQLPTSIREFERIDVIRK